MDSAPMSAKYRWVNWLCAGAFATLASVPTWAANGLEIETLSNRPNKISGGEVLVRVNVPRGTQLRDITIRLNGIDVTSAFWQDAGGHALTGLVTNLIVGTNRLEATGRHGSADRIKIQNHEITGPVFSGPQEQPFFCQTHQFPVPGGGFLTSSPIADPCFVPARVDYAYRSTQPGVVFKLLSPTEPRPTDIATTTTGAPYIFRLETGTINRAIYQIAILDDPAVPGPDPRQGSDPGWNRKLVYTFGGGCNAGWYIQGAATGGVVIDAMLSRGFAVASSSLNVLGQNCNDVLSAETLMMVKEHFVETYGDPRYTIGWGCSGGAIQQYMIADNYPGLLNGLVPQCSFPDPFGSATTDARLMFNYYFNSTTRVRWTEEELRAASGFGTFGQISNQGTFWAARIDPVPNRAGFPPNSSWLYNPVVPGAARYDPAANPGGARATIYDHNVNTFGRDENGFARRPLDNVGVQYGLAALNAGQITLEQFLDLNQKIGGFDADANFIPERTKADRKATRAAYQTGKVLDGGGGLRLVPILDVDGLYTDLAPAGDIHMKYNHFATRERLLQANGHADNMVMWSGGTLERGAFVSTEALLQIDEWLTAVAADRSAGSVAAKVVRNKPAALVDGCWTGTTAPFSFVAERQFFGGADTSICNSLYPAYGFPRYVAGQPLSNDVVKCSLREVDLDDYAMALTPGEELRLHQIFPQGVCDYLQRGSYRPDLLGTWLNYIEAGKYKRDNGEKN